MSWRARRPWRPWPRLWSSSTNAGASYFAVRCTKKRPLYSQSRSYIMCGSAHLPRVGYSTKEGKAIANRTELVRLTADPNANLIPTDLSYGEVSPLPLYFPRKTLTTDLACSVWQIEFLSLASLLLR